VTGNKKPWPRAVLHLLQTQQAGFTYLWLILTVAIASAGGAALGEMWQTQSLRSKEQEQVFRLGSFAAALNSYAAATPTGMPCLPSAFEDLLEDKRSGKLKRHLRTLYPDPFTGKFDWVVERSLAGGIKNIKSGKHQIELLTANANPATSSPPGLPSSTGSMVNSPPTKNCTAP